MILLRLVFRILKGKKRIVDDIGWGKRVLPLDKCLVNPDLETIRLQGNFRHFN